MQENIFVTDAFSAIIATSRPEEANEGTVVYTNSRDINDFACAQNVHNMHHRTQNNHLRMNVSGCF